MQTTHVIDVDGDDLVAVHHEATTQKWLVFSHGFVSDKEGSYESRATRAVEEGYNAVRFDHRGCGESDRSFGEQTLSTRIADLHAVLEHFQPESCVLFGSSFGGKVVFHAASELHQATDEHCLRALAVRAPVTFIDVFDHYRPTNAHHSTDSQQGVGLSATFFEDFDSYPFASVTGNVPVFIFHGRADETVPISSSLTAIEELETDVTFQQFVDEGHNFTREGEQRLQDQLFGWLSQRDW